MASVSEREITCRELEILILALSQYRRSEEARRYQDFNDPIELDRHQRIYGRLEGKLAGLYRERSKCVGK